MKKFMKQHWKIITGVFFLIGGLANIGDDTEAAIFGIVVGAAFIVWWVLGRKNLQEKISHQTDYQFISSRKYSSYCVGNRKKHYIAFYSRNAGSPTKPISCL